MPSIKSMEPTQSPSNTNRNSNVVTPVRDNRAGYYSAIQEQDSGSEAGTVYEDARRELGDPLNLDFDDPLVQHVLNPNQAALNVSVEEEDTVPAPEQTTASTNAEAIARQQLLAEITRASLFALPSPS